MKICRLQTCIIIIILYKLKNYFTYRLIIFLLINFLWATFDTTYLSERKHIEWTLTCSPYSKTLQHKIVLQILSVDCAQYTCTVSQISSGLSAVEISGISGMWLGRHPEQGSALGDVRVLLARWLELLQVGYCQSHLWKLYKKKPWKIVRWCNTNIEF